MMVMMIMIKKKNNNDNNDNHNNHNNNHKHKIKKYCLIIKKCISIVTSVINILVIHFRKN